MTRKLNKADQWLINEVEKELITTYNLDKKEAGLYIKHSSFYKMLQDKSNFVHHEGIEKWVSIIALHKKLKWRERK
ncbi:hypothetical protein CVD19_00705 [Bacillus sp. T33-2]|nr:hypothetical protein CVD19_00705 [Bacillus sp. T33-2]